MGKKKLDEDGGAVAGGAMNSAGSGAIAGIGVGKQGEPGVSPNKKRKSPVMVDVLRRKRPMTFREFCDDNK